MVRAQKRDAVRAEKFFFRKDVFPSASSQPSSVAPSTPSSPVSEHGAPVLVNGTNGKEKKLRNCFPLPPMPDDAFVPGSVTDEYEEMSMEEIMNGKVRVLAGWAGRCTASAFFWFFAAPGNLRLIRCSFCRAQRSRGFSTWYTCTSKPST